MRKQFQIKFWPTEIFVRCLDLFLEKTEFARIHEGTGLKTFQFVLGIIVNVTKKNLFYLFYLLELRAFSCDVYMLMEA